MKLIEWTSKVLLVSTSSLIFYLLMVVLYTFVLNASFIPMPQHCTYTYGGSVKC